MNLLTSDEFARWFTALDERTAEDVAATIEVIAELGTKKEAPGSSEWLTWYEHPGLAPRFRELGRGSPVTPAMARFIDEWGAFSGYAKRVVKQLESKAFAARVAKLDAERAACVHDAVARIKKTVTRRTLALSEYQVRRHLGVRAPTPAEEADLARFLDVDEVRGAYLAALAAAGFEVADVPAHTAALREIALRTPPPGLRILYGVDVARDRALVVLGERLDRSFYGDSVRRAERMWHDFTSGSADAQPLPRR